MLRPMFLDAEKNRQLAERCAQAKAEGHDLLFYGISFSGVEVCVALNEEDLPPEEEDNRGYRGRKSTDITQLAMGAIIKTDGIYLKANELLYNFVLPLADSE